MSKKRLNTASNNDDDHCANREIVEVANKLLSEAKKLTNDDMGLGMAAFAAAFVTLAKQVDIAGYRSN
jgi:hypothetical protein